MLFRSDGKIVGDEKNESIARTREQIAADKAAAAGQQAKEEQAPAAADAGAANTSTGGAE